MITGRNKLDKKDKATLYNQRPDRRFKNQKSRSKTSRKSFNISLKNYLSLLELPCFYCGGSRPETGVGLDRIDNSKPYLLSNVVRCCGNCNYMKNDLLTGYEMKALIGVLRKLRGGRVWDE